MNWTIIITIFILPGAATFALAWYARRNWYNPAEKSLRQEIEKSNNILERLKK